MYLKNVIKNKTWFKAQCFENSDLIICYTLYSQSDEINFKNRTDLVCLSRFCPSGGLVDE